MRTWSETHIDNKRIDDRFPDAIVGRYSLLVQATTKLEDGTNKHHKYPHPEKIIVLFNAWCKGIFYSSRDI